MDNQVIASLIAVLGTLGGAFVTSWVQRDSKKITSLQSKVDRYRAEIRARQAEEDVAAEWLTALGAATTPRAAKTLLREKTERQKGLRPGVGPAEVRDARAQRC